MAGPVIAHTAPTFWGMTIYAHFDMAQLIAFKLFDEQRNALTIEYLLDRAAEHPEVFPKGTAEQVAAIVGIAREQISNLSIHLIPIRAKRNRIIAHADSTIVRDPERLAKDTQVTFLPRQHTPKAATTVDRFDCLQSPQIVGANVIGYSITL